MRKQILAAGIAAAAMLGGTVLETNASVNQKTEAKQAPVAKQAAAQKDVKRVGRKNVAERGTGLPPKWYGELLQNKGLQKWIKAKK